MNGLSKGWFVAALIAVASLGAACGDPPHDHDAVVVAFVGREPIYLEQLERYLEENLIDVEEGESEDRAASDAVRSRLLDALIEERALLAEALRRDVQVSPREVEIYLELGPGHREGEVDNGKRRSERAREVLLVQKLQEQVVLDQPEATDDEVRDYVVENGDRLLPDQPVVLSALQLRSEAQANRVHTEISRKRMTFREAVIAFEPTPGQSEAQRIDWEALSPELREALKNLKPGHVSKPLELHGGWFLFEVSSWLNDPGDRQDELLRRGRAELESRRRQQALDALLVEARQRVRVRLRPDNLPFGYAPD